MAWCLVAAWCLVVAWTAWCLFYVFVTDPPNHSLFLLLFLDPNINEPVNSVNYGFYAEPDLGADFVADPHNWGESAAIDGMEGQDSEWMDHQGYEDPGFNPI